MNKCVWHGQWPASVKKAECFILLKQEVRDLGNREAQCAQNES